MKISVDELKNVCIKIIVYINIYIIIYIIIIKEGFFYIFLLYFLNDYSFKSIPLY